MNIIAHIPIRKNSKRLKNKNLIKIDGKYLFEYALMQLKKSKIKDFYLNTDSEKIIKYAIRNKINYYRRPKNLATDTATSDQFNYDFIKKKKPDILVMINPVCPLITFHDIDKAFDIFLNKKVDTLISSTKENMQTFVNNIPVNININQQLQPSQDNKKTDICNWAISIWDAKKFTDRFKKKGYAVWGKKRHFFNIPKNRGLKISKIDDLKIFKNIIREKKNKSKFSIIKFKKLKKNNHKISAIVPIKLYSERLSFKNFKLLNGKPLYYYILKTLSKVDNISEIIVNSDAVQYKTKIQKISKKIKFIIRPNYLRSDNCNFNKILSYSLNRCVNDNVIQCHVTSPLLKSSTISQAVNNYFYLKKKNKFSTLFSVSSMRKRFYDYKFKNINFSEKDKKLSSKMIKELYFDNSLFYIFSKKNFLSNENRLGTRPCAVVLNSPETLDIDYNEDFKLAKKLIK